MRRQLPLRFLFAVLLIAVCGMTGVFASSGGESSKPAGIVAPKNTTAIIKHPFADGGTHITTTSRLEFYKAKGSRTYGSPDGGLFVAPRSQIDNLLSGGASRREIEVALGLNENALQGGRLIRIDVDNPFSRGLRLPSGGNIYHRPGTGLTTGNIYEGVIDAARIGTPGVRKSIIWGR